MAGVKSRPHLFFVLLSPGNYGDFLVSEMVTGAFLKNSSRAGCAGFIRT